MHVGGLHGNDGEQFFFQKPNAFDYGTYGLSGGGAWGLGRLEDCSRQLNQQCASLSIE
jgi:hypothetical protein